MLGTYLVPTVWTTEKNHPSRIIKRSWGNTWGFPTHHNWWLFVLVNLFQAWVSSCWEAGAIWREWKPGRPQSRQHALAPQHTPLPLQNTKRSPIALFISQSGSMCWWQFRFQTRMASASRKISQTLSDNLYPGIVHLFSFSFPPWRISEKEFSWNFPHLRLYYIQHVR